MHNEEGPKGQARPLTDSRGTHLGGKGEATAYPVWFIINPWQMMRPDVYAVNEMVTGPFFSRETAQRHLDGRRYAFGKHAKVFCASGYWSRDYRYLCEHGTLPAEVTGGDRG